MIFKHFYDLSFSIKLICAFFFIFFFFTLVSSLDQTGSTGSNFAEIAQRLMSCWQGRYCSFRFLTENDADDVPIFVSPNGYCFDTGILFSHLLIYFTTATNCWILLISALKSAPNWANGHLVCIHTENATLYKICRLWGSSTWRIWLHSQKYPRLSTVFYTSVFVKVMFAHLAEPMTWKWWFTSNLDSCLEIWLITDNWM